MARERCSWCGVEVALDEGYRAAEQSGERLAVFCRLEHVVPWAIQGPHWDAGVLPDEPRPDPELGHCAHCGGEVDDTRVLLVHHRSEHRIADAFCTSDHLSEWAKAGGRWQ